ncbi:flagellar motor protein MotB [Ramlibacter sp.]|uniref:flagellar motor protein MotB n=1 Tax=Ramlibacter sp. TaxID=1917967 RepID=UPI002D19DF67|nr:flagellar motor protein MotB [Ramlibacter sp.]HWI83362.1 flagellar motor protein MotB [Ramlibacter sp.]
MKEEKQQRIVVKRRGHGGDGHGGGAWKIAYADFMTAMMAFFLVMWLLSSATPKQLQGVAEHFRMPLRVALEGGPKSSLSSSVIPGGGADPMHKAGEVRESAADADHDGDAQALEDMKDRLEELIRESPVFQQFRSQLLVDITTEGLRLQIVDSENRPMFELASASVVPHMRAILRELAPVINGWPNKVTLAGHTDSIVYASGDRAYSNWELSADRANASRRELAAGGLADAKVLRVMGLADSMHLDKADPRNPINRRISIVVLNARTQQRIEQENTGQAGATRSVSGPLAAARPAPPPAAGATVVQAAQVPAPARQ